MSNYREEQSQSSPFKNGTDQQGRRTPHENNTPSNQHDQLVGRFRRFIAQKLVQGGLSGDDTPENIIQAELERQSGRGRWCCRACASLSPRPAPSPLGTDAAARPFVKRQRPSAQGLSEGSPPEAVAAITAPVLSKLHGFP